MVIGHRVDDAGLARTLDGGFELRREVDVDVGGGGVLAEAKAVGGIAGDGKRGAHGQEFVLIVEFRNGVGDVTFRGEHVACGELRELFDPVNEPLVDFVAIEGHEFVHRRGLEQGHDARAGV